MPTQEDRGVAKVTIAPPGGSYCLGVAPHTVVVLNGLEPGARVMLPEVIPDLLA